MTKKATNVETKHFQIIHGSKKRIIKGNFKYFLLNENESNSQNNLQNVVLYSYKRKEEMSQINLKKLEKEKQNKSKVSQRK